jgi:hypothetical protein
MSDPKRLNHSSQHQRRLRRSWLTQSSTPDESALGRIVTFARDHINLFLVCRDVRNHSLVIGDQPLALTRPWSAQPRRLPYPITSAISALYRLESMAATLRQCRSPSATLRVASALCGERGVASPGSRYGTQVWVARGKEKNHVQDHHRDQPWSRPLPTAILGRCADGLRRQAGCAVDIDVRSALEPRQRKQGSGESWR